MNKIIFIKHTILLIFTIILFGCSSIDYSSTRSIPHEAQKEVVQITNENVAGPHVLINENTINWYTPSYLKISSDGKYYAYFTSETKDGITDFNILIKNIANDSLVLGKRIFGDVAGLDFSPNAKNLVFSAFNEGSFNIHIMDIASGKINMNVISSKANETCPVYSKDGNIIIYAQALQTTKSINQIPAASRTSSKFKYKKIKKHIQKVSYKVYSKNLKENKTKTYMDAYSPAIINDIDILACKNNTDKGLGEIWKINTVSGMGNSLIKSYRKGYSTPCASPDGKKIVFVGSTLPKNSKTPINLDIYVSNIDGSQLEQITFHPGHDLSPVWSHDMKWIYFISERGNEKRKYNVWKIEYKGL
ncbi:MAG: hypothetical protein K9J13_08990 [Saprospiraceae bacterium]|nr:hypothetical protein [Saprospiraceae bacterium]